MSKSLGWNYDRNGQVSAWLGTYYRILFAIVKRKVKVLPTSLAKLEHMKRLAAIVAAVLVCYGLAISSARKHHYLVVWAGDDDKKVSDFLAVIDADPGSPKYGEVLATKPVGATGSMPHHTEDVVAANHHLLANGFDAGKTWLFDLSKPLDPKVLTSLGDLDGYNHPHSYIRLPNEDVLATFQYHGERQTGGLVEFAETGRVVRSGSAVDAANPSVRIQPYSVVALPAIDRAISTDTSMMDSKAPGGKVQLWRLSDLKLLSTFDLPPGPKGNENQWTGEPRMLPDGSVYVHTFHCGLYRLTNLQSGSPKAEFIRRFEGDNCAVPIQTGHWWLQTVPAIHAVVALNISDPEHPKEVSRLTLDAKQEPHWIALEEPGGKRIVVNSGEYADHRIFIANFDQQTGALTLDEKFRDPGSNSAGVSMDGKTWPHGFHGNAYPHGTVFLVR